MAMTFSVGTTLFDVMQNTAGRKAMNLKVGAAKMKKDRFHVPGVDGNYIIRQGRIGRSIMLHAAYIGLYNDVLGLIDTDREAWVLAAQTITDDGGYTYAGCNLEAMNRLGPPVGFRNNDDTATWVIIEYEMIFEQDA